MSKDSDEIIIAGKNDSTLIGVVSEIVSAYVGNNPVPVSDLPGLIENTYNVVSELNGRIVKETKADQKPAVSVRKSLSEDYVICLEDGKKFKSLKRHLRTRYNMSPEEYREKWGLSPDYPMVAPNYAKQRSDLAKRMGLGQAKK
ncbi:MucR family transcriptional regulator [Hirschia baltica]|uniref:Transcriptional regulator, MucR family n=1 Tax=Hirschia baltica (strain ATCC 49814 / DSM 5838 / IFAM 1418) TaxID=582402 RepID=C6XI94_HIRBI|nr:MucR family transcriptional regulator [Hirschia baltica]ACT58920.1 transcriptional regulator, MucR family [Hirschia baltica ATCC 49814]